MKKNTIVLYPAVGRGHLLSMVELGKLILTHHPSLSITILLPTTPNDTTTKIDHTTFGCDAAITFHHIPAVPIPDGIDSALPPHLLAIELSPRSNQTFHHLLKSISKTSNLKAIVLDFMNYSAPNVTAMLGIPTYFYYTSGVSSLAVLLNHNGRLPAPGLPGLSRSDLPDPSNPSHPIYHVFCEIGRSMRQSAGVIVNTFAAAESRVVEALNNEGIFPPLFCIGPVISSPVEERDENGCLTWLDSQPSQSVVFLSFGSHGRLPKAQLKEIALGLEKSEQRFLWVVRSDEEPRGLDELLPEGFLERTKEKGMVVKNWAPQAAILSHDSVGGFVTHCGWNSVLEAVCEGVPMVAWPLYAEQKLNKVVMVNEMKVALGVNKDKDGFVSATEFGERVKELMDSNKGKEIRKNTFNMKIEAKEAKEEGGSSLVDLSRLVKSWKEQ